MTSPRDNYSWLAGICDAALKINARVKNGAICSLSMRARVTPDVARELVQMFKGSYHDGTWHAAPDRQQQLALVVLNLVRDPILSAKLRIVVRFRITRFKHAGFAKAVPDSVHELRRRLAVEFMLLDSSEKSLANRSKVRHTVQTPEIDRIDNAGVGAKGARAKGS